MILYGKISTHVSATRPILSYVAETRAEITKTKQILETAEMSALKSKKVNEINKSRQHEKSKFEPSTRYPRNRRVCEDTKDRMEELCITNGTKLDCTNSKRRLS
jgi:hypothetical protein